MPTPINFTATPTSATVHIGDPITVTITLATANPASFTVEFTVIPFIPTAPPESSSGDPMHDLFHGSQGVIGLIIDPIVAGCSISPGASTGSFTIYGYMMGVPAIGDTVTIYALPYSNSIGVRANDWGILVDKVVPITVTVIAPPLPPNPPPPAMQTHYLMFGSIGLPSGGGNPRLYALTARSTGLDPFHLNTLALRFCVSLDFGESFLPGVDIGVRDSTNAAIPDGTQGNYGGVFLSVLPSGELYANGTFAIGTSPSFTDWYSARLSSDGGRTWRAASQANNTIISTHYVAATFGAAPWVTRGGYEGSKGAGGQSAGAHRFLKIARSSIGGAGVRVESLDAGDTWAIPSDLSAVGSQDSPQWQLQAVWGVSTDGQSYSLDDYQSAAGYHALTDYPNTIGKIVQSADNDVIYRLYGRPYGTVGQVSLLRSRQPFTPANTYAGTETLPCWWSPNKDGTDLLPIPFPGDPADMLGWQWKGRIVLLVRQTTDASVIQCYVSDNENGWFRKTCHTADGGTSWVND